MLPWVIRVIGLVTFFSPVMVTGQQTAPSFPEFPSGESVIDAPESTVAEPIPFQAPAISTPFYWIASSRCLPQEAVSCASGQLGYFQRDADGCLRPSSRDAMVSQFQPGVPICIFIHGSFVDWEYEKAEATRTYNWIRGAAPQLPAHFIFYTWPSEAKHEILAAANHVAINQRGRWAENNAFYLADLIAQFPPESPVCLVGHSHGVRLATATLHLMGGGAIHGMTYPYDTGCRRRCRAVFAAGAIDRQWLNPGQRYDMAVCRAEGILLMVNPADPALHFYPLRCLFSRKAISTTGLTRWDERRLGTLANKVIEYDVTRLIGMHHLWPYYLEQPSLALAISPYVYFTDSQLNPTYTLAAGS